MGSEALTTHAGAKLEVDSRAYPGGAVWVRLVDCAKRATSFAPEDIAVAGPGVVRQNRDEDSRLFTQRGLVIGVQ